MTWFFNRMSSHLIWFEVLLSFPFWPLSVSQCNAPFHCLMTLSCFGTFNGDTREDIWPGHEVRAEKPTQTEQK